ncbi:MAG: hypothetical protein KGJ02_07510 [Verrucomicrobiota bacterium]|nr:hypothetical protein [Verrucomicrobiota bacterium]
MNILPFIFAILLIFAYAVAASFEKHLVSIKTQNAYLGLRKAERRILYTEEDKKFNALPGTLTKQKKKEKPEQTATEKAFPPINPACARLNLFPLVNEGKEAHPELYNMATKLLHFFYEEQLEDPKILGEFLDLLLESAKPLLKTQDKVALETLALKDAVLQPLYYRLLKGTKKPDLFSAKGYPSLIDYLKIERSSSTVCLFHAHPHALVPFFGMKAAPRLYQLVHEEKKAGFEVEALIALLGAPHLRFLSPDVWKLINLQRPTHAAEDVALVEDDPETGISLRKSPSSVNQ